MIKCFPNMGKRFLNVFFFFTLLSKLKNKIRGYSAGTIELLNDIISFLDKFMGISMPKILIVPIKSHYREHNIEVHHIQLMASTIKTEKCCCSNEIDYPIRKVTTLTNKILDLLQSKWHHPWIKPLLVDTKEFIIIIFLTLFYHGIFGKARLCK